MRLCTRDAAERNNEMKEDHEKTPIPEDRGRSGRVQLVGKRLPGPLEPRTVLGSTDEASLGVG